ncbi:MAG: LysE family translocator [Candidatus Poseidoniaceae archaeon]
MAVETEAILGLLTILSVGIFTPGPNNITAISHSAVHGARSNVSLLVGMVVGFILVHLIIGLTVEQIDKDSILFSFLEWFGLLFFVLLGVIILRLPIERLSVDENIQRIDYRHGILLQFVNGKEWVFVSVIMIEFLEGFGGGMSGILLITSITTTGGLLSMILWTMIGHKLMDTLRHERRGKVMIRCLAGAIFLFAGLGLVRQLV